MMLSEIKDIVNVVIENDSEFLSLGAITHHSPKMLVFIENERFLPTLLANANISCIILTPDLLPKLSVPYGIAVTDNPRKIFHELHNILALHTNFYWNDFASEISSEACIHPNAYVAPRNVRIGKGTVIEPGVTILERSIIGEDVILRSGCTIGSQGFEFKRIGGKVLSVAHAGGVRLGHRVEIQANCAISRSVFGGFTELGEDTKLDNLVHIAHNVRIGKRCFFAACAMIAGSVTIGDDVWVGPNASISNEITIGDGAMITIGAVVVQNVRPAQKVSGNFAIDHEKFITFIKSIR